MKRRRPLFDTYTLMAISYFCCFLLYFSFVRQIYTHIRHMSGTLACKFMCNCLCSTHIFSNACSLLYSTSFLFRSLCVFLCLSLQNNHHVSVCMKCSWKHAFLPKSMCTCACARIWSSRRFYFVYAMIPVYSISIHIHFG